MTTISAVLFIDYNILYSIIRGVYGHIDGQYPWYSIEDFVQEESAKIVGKIVNVVDLRCKVIILQVLNQLKSLQ